jgi:hypothetical protein
MTAVTVATAVPAAAATATATGPIYSGIAGECVNDSGLDVTINPCVTGAGAQQWQVMDDGTVQLVGSACLDTVDGSLNPGTQVGVRDCVSGSSSQQWQMDGTELLNPASGLCLDAPGTSDGTVLDIADCVGGNSQTFSEPAPTGDIVLSQSVTGLDPARLQAYVNDVNSEFGNQSLSADIQGEGNYYEKYWTDPGPVAPIPAFTGFRGGTMTVSSSGSGASVVSTLTIDIPASDVTANVNWGPVVANLIGGALGIVLGIIAGSLCTLAFAPAAPIALTICRPVGSFVLGFIWNLVSNALQDADLSSPDIWGQALVVGAIAAVGAVVVGPAVGWFAANGARVLANVGTAIGGALLSVGRWFGAGLPTLARWARTLAAFVGLSSAINWVRGVGPALRSLLGNRPLPFHGGIPMRPLEFGDSITFGDMSSDGGGYRCYLQDDLTNDAAVGADPASTFEYVGSQTGGPCAQPANEGHNGWTIEQLAGIEHCTITGFKPNIVFLDAGTNDIRYGMGSTAVAALQSLISSILADDPGVVVMVASLIPMTDPTLGAEMVTFNQGASAMVNGLASAGAHVAWVDMGAVITGTDQADGLHPNDVGYQKMASAWNMAVENLDPAWLVAPTGTPAGTCGGSSNGLGAPNWFPQGEFASGYLAQLTSPMPQPGGTLPAGAHVQLADINGDGKADFLQINADGSVVAWLNTSVDPAGVPVWIYQGVIADGVGAPGDEVQFAHITGLRRADYVVVNPASGSLTVWANGGQIGPTLSQSGNGTPWAWHPLGTIAPGVGVPGSEVQLANIIGSGRADYVVVNPTTGSLTVWYNNGPDSNSPSGWDWNPLGTIAPGVGVPGSEVRLADMNGDGKADYVVVNPASGSLTVWLNGGYDTKSPSAWDWNPQGVIAPGVNLPMGDDVELVDVNGDGKADYLDISSSQAIGTSNFNFRISMWLNSWTGSGSCCWAPLGEVANGVRGRVVVADIDGDKKADYLYITAYGAVYAWLNGGWNGTQWIWNYQGAVAPGAGYPGSEVQMADIDGDGKADYLVVNPTTGAVTAWLNGGHDPTSPSGWDWNPQGVIAPGVGAPGSEVQFADVNGDGKADYLVVGAGYGSVTAWFNGGHDSNSPSGWDWNPQGVIAPGVGDPGSQIRFASLYGSGRADYLDVQPNSGVDGWQNAGPDPASPSGWDWNPQGVVAAGVAAATGGAMSAPGYQIQFADINGDGKADYLDIDPTNGSIYAWTNTLTH